MPVLPAAPRVAASSLARAAGRCSRRPPHRRRRWVCRVVGRARRSTRSRGSPRPPGPAARCPLPGRLAFTAVEPSLMTAVVDVVPIANGTELRVECQYATADRGRQLRPGPGDRDGAADAGPPRVTGATTGSTTRSGSSTATGRPPSCATGPPGPDRIMHPSGCRRCPSRRSPRSRSATSSGQAGRSCGPDAGPDGGRTVFRRARCWCYCFVRIKGLWRSW